MRFNLILFVLVLVNQYFIEGAYDDKCGTSRAIAQRAKTTHLTSARRGEAVRRRLVIRLLYSDT